MSTVQLPCSCLIVEDDAVLARGLELGLRGGSTTVDMSSNGLEALLSAQRTTYDLIVTDYTMPLMNGVELIGNLRASGVGAFIVLMTAVDIKQTALEIGADLFMYKPFTPRVLVERIRGPLTTRMQMTSAMPACGNNNLAAELYDLGEPDPTQNERRAVPRRRVDVPIMLRRTGDLTISRGRVIDAAPMSLGLICDDYFPVGTHIEVRLEDADAPWCAGAIIHATPHDHAYRVGFTTI